MVLPYQHLTLKNGGCHQCYIKSRSGEWKYTIDEIKEVAKRYDNKKDFRDEHYKLWSFISRHGLIDEVCGHMRVLGNFWNRLIYAYEFDINGKKYAYIGLTYDIKKRHKQHMCKGGNSSVLEFCNKNGIEQIPEPKVIVDYLPKDQASIMEQKKAKEYKNNGYILLNKVKCGGLGGNEKSFSCDLTEAKDIAKKYKNRTEWNKNDGASYNYCVKKGWMDKLIPLNIKRWSVEEAIEEAKKYEKPFEMEKENYSLYRFLKSRNLWSEATKHMEYDREWGFYKQIVALDCDGNFVKEYEKIVDAAKEYKTTNSCLKNYLKQNIKKPFNGVIWFYKKEYDLLKDDKQKILNRIYHDDESRHVLQINIETGEVVAEYETVYQAEHSFGFHNNGCIYKCLKGKQKSWQGFKWVLKHDYQQKQS